MATLRMSAVTVCAVLSLAVLTSVGGLGRTAHAQVQAQVTVVNRMPAAVRLFWFNPQTRQETLYATIAAGGSYAQQTFRGHTWIVRDAAGKELRRLTMTQPVQSITIAPQQNPVRKSLPGGVRATLTIFNRTQGNVEVMWVTYDGAEKSYGILAPGKSMRRITGTKQLWIVRDQATKRELQAITVTSPKQVVSVGDGGQQPVGNTVTVPYVTGSSKSAAEQKLRAAGLTVISKATPRTNNAPLNFVFNQRPLPGTKVQRGSQVTVFYYGKPATTMVTVPAVIGKSKAQAEAALRAAGLQVTSTPGNAASRTNLTGVVYQQSLSAGSRVAKSTAVTVIYYRQPNPPPVVTVAVPNLIGQSRSAAASALTQAGLTPVATAGNTTTNSSQIDTVYAQSVAADSRVNRQTTVSFSYYRPAPRYTGPTPQDADSSIPVPSMVAHPNADGSLDIVWKRSDGATLFSTYSGAGYQSSTHTQLSGLLQLLGGFTKDDQGNGYVLTARQESQQAGSDPRLRRRGILQIHKIATGQRGAALFADLNQPGPSGAKSGRFYTKWGVYNPIIHSGNVRTSARLKHGGGVLAATFVHNIPGSDGVLHNTGCLLAVDTSGNPVYAGGAENHAMDVQISYDGSTFVRAQETDQGIVVSQLSPGSDGKWKWTDDKMGVAAAQAGLKHFFRLGGFVSTPSKHLLVYSYVENGWGYHQNEQEFVAGTTGAALYVTTLPKNLGPLPKFDWRTRAIGRGILQKLLVRPPGSSNIVRPQVVDMNSGRYVLVWEQWSSSSFGKGMHERTMAMVIDSSGNTVVAAKELPGARINRSTDAFYLPASRRAGFIAGNAAQGKIMLHTLDGQLNLQSHALPIQ